MWYAGAGWREDHYAVAVLDESGLPVLPPAVFPAHLVDQLVDLLRECERRAGLVVVIDSTTGVLERHLVEAGLAVHRADPWHVPNRLASGSADPAELARAGLHRGALNRLTPESGGLHGRDEEVDRAERDSVTVERTLAAAGQLLTRAVSEAPEVALTFDDGPSPRFTTEVLDVLHRYGAVATFFCIGLNAHAHPAVVERIAAEGHTVANHTWSHPYLPDLTRGELEGQLERTNAALTRATGRTPTLVRPPYGGRSPDVLRWLAAAGLTTVLWDVETTDWARPGADVIERGVVDGTRGGSVVLLHDGGGDRAQTVAALPRILAGLIERGYRLVPVSRFVSAA